MTDASPTKETVKLSHKEKKKLKKQIEYDKQMDVICRKGGLGHSELEDNFTISQVQQSEKKLAQSENAVDIKIENFNISAKGKFVRHGGCVSPLAESTLFGAYSYVG